jgi:nucleoside-diphosphate-sugar epimerase
MKHLITGGAGFLGHLIAQRLLAQGEEVRVLDLGAPLERSSGIEVMVGSVLDQQAVARAMEGVEMVHHNAALVPLTKSGKKFWDVNVTGSEIVATEAVRAGVQHFIHMSSSAVYGKPLQVPITTDTPAKPVEIYGRAKLAGEQAVRAICEHAGLPCVMIRPRTILGQGRMGIFHLVFDWIHRGKNIYLIGDGSQRFQFVHANDLIDAYLLIVRHHQTGIFNVGTDRFGTLRASLEHVIQFAQSPSRIVGLPPRFTIAMLRLFDLLRISPLAPWHYLTSHVPFYFDVSPLLALGWKPQYSNDEMFQESYEWFLRHPEGEVLAATASVHRRPVQEQILKILKRFS